MGSIDKTSAPASELLADDRHYVAAVAALGDTQAVIADADIFAANGMKLVAKGAAIDSRLRDKLFGHALRQPLDSLLRTEHAVSPESLARDAAEVLDNQVWWRQLAARSGDPLAMRHGLARLTLPGPLRFKLTVARSQRLPLYRHLLQVTLICDYLALRLALPEREHRQLQLAALSHDLGEMHTDPELLAPQHRMTDAERRFVYVHPLAGGLILRALSGIDPAVIRAVEQHHERLDGSGYPAGLRGDAIGQLGRLLAVADVAETVLARTASRHRVSALLRLNLRKYDAVAVSLLHEALAGLDEPGCPVDHPPVAPRLAALAGLLGHWESFLAGLRTSMPTGQPAALNFLAERVCGVQRLLAQFGFDPSGLDGLASLAAADRDLERELAAVLDEVDFQWLDMRRELARRGDLQESDLPTEVRAGYRQWRGQLDAMAEVAAGAVSEGAHAAAGRPGSDPP